MRLCCPLKSVCLFCDQNRVSQRSSSNARRCSFEIRISEQRDIHLQQWMWKQPLSAFRSSRKKRILLKGRGFKDLQKLPPEPQRALTTVFFTYTAFSRYFCQKRLANQCIRSSFLPQGHLDTQTRGIEPATFRQQDAGFYTLRAHSHPSVSSGWAEPYMSPTLNLTRKSGGVAL